MVKIKIIQLGDFPFVLNFERIEKWQSQLFSILPKVCKLVLNGNPTGTMDQYTDGDINGQIGPWITRNSNIDHNELADVDILFIVTHVSLEKNHFLRSLSNNKACLTYHDLVWILKEDNIPLDNLLLRGLYFISLIYLYNGNKIPLEDEVIDIVHHESKGCIFDFNYCLREAIYSLSEGPLCSTCEESLKDKVPEIDEKLIIKKRSLGQLRSLFITEL